MRSPLPHLSRWIRLALACLALHAGGAWAAQQPSSLAEITAVAFAPRARVQARSTRQALEGVRETARPASAAPEEPPERSRVDAGRAASPRERLFLEHRALLR